MGWSCCWIAVRGREPDRLLGDLGLQRTGGREEHPGSPWTAAELPGGWFLVFRSDRCDPAAFGEAALPALSADCEVVRSCVEEHVMFCSTAFWRHGAKEWEVSHDAQAGTYDLRASGALPESFAALRDRYFREQEAEGGAKAGVDLVFEIPMELGAGLTGFRHDGAFPASGSRPFEVLAAALDEAAPPSGRKPWWKVW